MIDFIISKIKLLSSSWVDELELMNVYEDVEPLYNIKDKGYNPNVALAFIILSYDRRSEWIQIHKDRIENKTKIMQTIAGLSCMSVERYANIVKGKDDAANQVISWFLDYQKDWRWKTIVRCFEYHSTVMNMPQMGTSKDTLDIGRCITEAVNKRKEGEKLWKEIKTEFVNLDTILEQEGKHKITENIDFMSHEQFILKHK
jgi:hypothetical protein